MPLDVPRTALDATFDVATRQRGHQVVRSGLVRDVKVTAMPHGGHVVVGTIDGTAWDPYAVEVGVWSTRHGWRIDATCSCPVRTDCKHAFAALVVATEPAQAPGWERTLSSALSGLEDLRAPADVHTPLGLLLDLAQPSRSSWAGSTRSLSMRPVRRSAKGTWVKTNASWSDVRHGSTVGHRYDPAQTDALSAISSAFNHGYVNQNPQVLLQNALLWPLLQRCVDAGVEIVAGTSLTSVVVSTPLSLTSDLACDGADVVLSTGVVHDDVWWPAAGREVELVGHPAHGVALLRDVAPPGSRTSPAFELVLAPLTAPVSEGTRQLVAEPLRIPAEEQERFLDTFLPRLRRQITVTSRDDSVTLPAAPRPRLQVTVTWSASHQAETAWAWAYGSARFGLRDVDGLLQVRDLVAENDVLMELELEEPALVDVAGQLIARRSWTGRDLVELSMTVLPHLRELSAADRFDLVEVGEQRDYRPAERDPQVRFDLEPETTPGPTDWLDLTVTITVDEESVPLAEALAALTRGDELVFTHSGRHVRTDHPAFERLTELVAAAGQLSDQPREGVRIGRTDLALWADLEAIGVVDAQAAEWMHAARALRDFERLPTVQPASLASELRPYQQTGLDWLAFLWEARLGGILADDMGLGKTLQALALVAHARERGADPFLVVAPTSVVTAWTEQARTHTPGLVVRSVGASAARRDQSLAELHDGADIVLTTYTLFRLEGDEYADLAWGGLLLDEAQHVKNHQGKTYHAIRRLSVPFRLALTGTPFENRLMELWSLLSIVAPGLYGSPVRFRDAVARPIEQRGDTETLDRFRRRIRPFLLRRTKEQVADDLPPKQEHVVPIDLGPRHRTIYDTRLQRERQTVMGLVDDFDRNRVAIFGALTRLRQLSLDPGLVDDAHAAVGSAKLDLLVEHLDEIVAEGHQVLVFSQFTGFLGRARARLDTAGISYAYLDGRTRHREVPIEQFRSGEASVFLISLKAGGVGLTLTEADYVYVLDPWWNPATEEQAIDRAHRIGQHKRVMVYRLVSSGTIEEKVVALKQRKAELFARVLDGDGSMSSALSAQDVRELFEA